MNDTLRDGAKALGVDLDDKKANLLLDYLSILNKWNKSYNLTAIKHIERMVPYHILDSLSVGLYLPSFFNILDVGSGGGMPGIPMGILYPDTKVTLIESNQKKSAFLQQAIVELGLRNVSVQNVRVEAYKTDDLFDVILSRAFSDISKFVNLSAHLLIKNGFWLAMKGEYPIKELSMLDQKYVVQGVYPVEVPGVVGSRHIVKISRLLWQKL